MDAEKLIYLRLTGEESIAICYFSHDAPTGPNVHLFTVMIAQEKLRSSIPSCGYVVRQLRSWLIQLSSESKVTDLKLIVSSKTNDQVSIFKIANKRNELCRVTVCK